MSSSSLSFAPPDDMEVRWQLFGILLCDQFEAANSVPRTKDSRKRKVAEVPEPAARCFQEGVSEDPVLRLALFSDPKTDADIIRHSNAVCDYVLRTSPKLPAYIRDAYTALKDTEDHILQIACLYFFVYWFTEYDEDSGECTLRRPEDAQARQTLEALGFRGDASALLYVRTACRDYEYGKAGVTTMTSFVHTTVGHRWRRLAPVPPCKRRRDQRKFSTSASQSSSDDSSEDSSDAASDATHSSSSSSDSCSVSEP